MAKDARTLQHGDIISIDKALFEQYAVHLPKGLVEHLVKGGQLSGRMKAKFEVKRRLPVLVGIRFTHEAIETIDKDRLQGLFPRSRAEYVRDAVNEYYLRRTGKLK